MPDRSELVRDFMLESGGAPLYRLDDSARSAVLPPAAIAIGAFDGMHRGHADLIARTVADARERGVAAYAVTFDPDPDRVVAPEPVPHLLAMEDRWRLLAASGVDGIVVIPFTPELARLDHAAFFERVLLPNIPLVSVHVGSDFRLGAGGASTVDTMRAWLRPRGIAMYGHDLVCDEGSVVSATRIRRSLAQGDVVGAARELGRRFAVRGTVEAGRHEGTDMGFPTANIKVPSGIQLPQDGVYAGLGLVGRTVWPAAINVGIPPMFAGCAGSAMLEANLIGFTGQIYGEACALAFDRRLRASQEFASRDDLIAAVLGNIDDVRQQFGESGVGLDL